MTTVAIGLPPLPTFTPRSAQDKIDKKRQLQSMSDLVSAMTVPAERVGVKRLTPINPSYFRIVQQIASLEGNCAAGDITAINDVFTAPLPNKRLFSEALGKVQAGSLCARYKSMLARRSRPTSLTTGAMYLSPQRPMQRLKRQLKRQRERRGQRA